MLAKRPPALLLALLSTTILTAQKPVSGPIIQTYAGADFTFQSEGQPAVNAPFGQPQDVNLDAAGNTYLADVYFHVLGINPDGRVRAIWIIGSRN